MKPQWNQNAYGIDLDYLRRCKESTPEQRLDWLAAAREFVMATKKGKQSPSPRGPPG